MMARDDSVAVGVLVHRVVLVVVAEAQWQARVLGDDPLTDHAKLPSWALLLGRFLAR